MCIRSRALLLFEVELYYMYVQVHVHVLLVKIFIYSLNYPLQISCLSFSEFCVLKHHLTSAENLFLLHHRYFWAWEQSTFLSLHNFLYHTYTKTLSLLAKGENPPHSYTPRHYHSMLAKEENPPHSHTPRRHDCLSRERILPTYFFFFVQQFFILNVQVIWINTHICFYLQLPCLSVDIGNFLTFLSRFI